LHCDYPEAWGGENKGPNPCEYLMVGLIGCEQMTVTEVAKEMGWDVTKAEFKAVMTLDMEKAATKPCQQPVKTLTLTATVHGDITQEQVTELGELVHSRCTVAAIFRHLPGCECVHVWTKAE
ncbi:OsmC/Ohr family protein, partial [Kipferlia bialata]